MPSPEEYDESMYKSKLSEELRRVETIVFDGVFTADGQHFIACNNFGRVSIWEIAHYLVRSTTNLIFMMVC